MRRKEKFWEAGEDPISHTTTSHRKIRQGKLHEFDNIQVFRWKHRTAQFIPSGFQNTFRLDGDYHIKLANDI